MSTLAMDELPGFSVHLTTAAKIRSFQERFEENMTWLGEVLQDAKLQFGREEIPTFPKTPAKRRRQRVNRRVSTLHNDDMGYQPATKKRKSSRVSMKSRPSLVAPVRRSTRNSVRTNQGGRCRTRSHKVVQIADGQEGHLGSVSASGSDDSGSPVRKALAPQEPKRGSPDADVIATAEALADTDDGAMQAVVSLSDDSSQAETKARRSLKTSKRSTTSKGKGRASKKLRLNSGQGVITVSDSSTSDEGAISRPAPAAAAAKQEPADSPSVTEKPEEVTADPASVPQGTGTAAGRPKRKNAASRYKDHVKRLINRHEHLIADQVSTSEDEFQSPVAKPKTTVTKPTRGTRLKKYKEAVAADEASESDFQSPVSKAAKRKPGGRTTRAARAKKSSRDEPVPDEVTKIKPKQEEIVVEAKADSPADSEDVRAETTEESAREEETRPTEKCKPPATPETVSVSDKEVLVPETDESDGSTDGCAASESPKAVAEEAEAVIAEAEPEAVEESPEVSAEREEEVAMDEDSLNQPEDAEESPAKSSMPEDSPDKAQAPEEPEPEPEQEEQQQSHESNMTADSLLLPDISLDSLDANSSHSSTQSRASRAHLIRQSLRKNLRQSGARRSSVAVSRSKKRSSVHQHRMSVRRSVRLSTCKPQQALTRTAMDRPQDAVPDKEQITIPIEEEEKETQSTPPRSVYAQPTAAIVQETQRVTRAASRIAEELEVASKENSLGTPQSRLSREDARSSASDDDDIIQDTPSPKCPANKVVRPRGTFLSAGKESRYLNNLHGMVSSFIKRNTPQKQSATERQQEIKNNIMHKQRRDEEIRRKLEADKLKQRELQKKKRDERIKKVTEARERRAALQEQKRQEIEQRQQELSRQTHKQREERRLEEMQRKHLLLKKKAEADERRKQEEQVRQLKIQEQEEEQKRHREMILRKREYEEQERHRRIEEARRLQEQRRLETERQRLEELQHRKELELAREREQQLLREQREREKRLEMEQRREMERRAREEALEVERQVEAERIARERERLQDQHHLTEMMKRERERLELERQQREQAEHDRLKASILKHNTSACANTSTLMNTTVTKETSPTSYDITPRRIPLPSTTENYVIDDIESGDSTDDEDAPRKIIPSWAKGAAFKAAVIKQFYHPPKNLDTLFGPILTPDLSIIFAKKSSRYLKRTSSAVWGSPMLKV